MECKCSKWKEGNKIYISMITLAYIHGLKPTIVDFKYCPWCGEKLVEQQIR